MNTQKESLFGPWETLVLWGLVLLAVWRWSDNGHRPTHTPAMQSSTLAVTK